MCNPLQEMALNELSESKVHNVLLFIANPRYGYNSQSAIYNERIEIGLIIFTHAWAS